ncbi:hypothetical protein T02_16509 [Trichinella nativa]|uniref:Uncharacterized protein n=1 Tax=Trichinella nativa TaxID=6335 RepID=A0A0V1KX39_9BILA|nr:hypothetical protein T02_16509 [Trichinella nativa]
MWQRAAGFLSAVMSPDLAQAKRQALLRNFTSSSISSSTGSSSEKVKKQMNMTTSLRIIRLFVMLWQSLKKNRRTFRIYYVKSTSICSFNYMQLKSISGTSNPEYIVGSISDSQVLKCIVGGDLHIVFVKCETIVQGCEFRRTNIKSAKAKQILRVGVKNRCRVSSPDEPYIVREGIEESGLMLDRNLHNAVEWVFVAWRKGKKNCHRVQYNVKKRIVMFSSLAPRRSDQRGYSMTLKVEKKTKERHVGTKGIYYIFH